MNSTPHPGPIVLGPQEVSLLVRLRAIALLYRAAHTDLPGLDDIDVVLWIGRSGRLCPLDLIGCQGCRLVVRAGGGGDLCTGVPSAQTCRPQLIYATRDRVAAAELPAEDPDGLLRLLRQAARGHDPSRRSAAALGRMGWRLPAPNGTLRPLLPLTVSAHEALEALLAAEVCGGLGSGPLGRLAAEAAARLTQGAR